MRAMSKRGTALWMGAAAVLLAGVSAAAADGVVTVINHSGSKVKVVGDGGSAVVDAGGDPVQVTFTGGKDMGIDAKIWWTANPRELCQLFVPWQRTIIVSGTSTIRCRSE
ncbi:MAG: hypothetical protein KIT00_09995 [Rhodospirillales bacterium]|nr:hypothetical protein [Rhodospirillales bacterium]